MRRVARCAQVTSVTTKMIETKIEFVIDARSPKNPWSFVKIGSASIGTAAAKVKSDIGNGKWEPYNKALFHANSKLNFCFCKK